jgi:pimeloyl-ACP methyl ester carboxylesterase
MSYAAGSDVEIWWTSVGNGEPVLLINGLSSPSATWFRLVRHLRACYRVLTFDNRGVGRTGIPEGPYSVPVMAADAAAVLDAAGEGSAHVLGMSMGGLIAQEFALSYPQRVRSLVLACTHVGIPRAVDPDPAVGEALARAAALPVRERMAALEPFIYAPGTAREDIDEDHSVRESEPTEETGYLNQLIGASTWEREADLHRICAPTLVLHGALDRLVPPRHAHPLVDAIPGARLCVLEGASHEVFTDQEETAAREVMRFFASASELPSVLTGGGPA